MTRFNLLEEPWIQVLTDNYGGHKEVSLLEVFRNAHLYKGLAGESKMQDFAIMRLLLAVIHTVFSRFDYDGSPFDYLSLDENYKQLTVIDEDDYDEFEEALINSLKNLWDLKSFPEIVEIYLKKWHERFYLFDTKYPFYQLNENEITKRPIKSGRGTEPTKISAKTLNRTISESSNKPALFAPRYGENKDLLSESELSRWLILYQGVVGTGDKASLKEYKNKNSKGWMYDIGGVILAGDSLFETLLLNLALVHPEREEFTFSIERPCWEYEGDEIVERLIHNTPIDNLSELYTNWSRGIYIDPKKELNKDFYICTVKLPEINHLDNFLELMTKWRFQNQGEAKDYYTPEKHRMNESFWRSFGSIFIEKENSKKPGIIKWAHELEKIVNKGKIIIESYGMESDRNATSWLPVDEYYDNLILSEFIFIDDNEGGWLHRIDGEVQKTKEVIDRTFRKFVEDVRKIRKQESMEFTNTIISQAYYEIDTPFRTWLSSLDMNDDKDDMILKWRIELKKIIREQADILVGSAGSRDFKYIDENMKPKNIAIIYNDFLLWLNRNLANT